MARSRLEQLENHSGSEIIRIYIPHESQKLEKLELAAFENIAPLEDLVEVSTEVVFFPGALDQHLVHEGRERDFLLGVLRDGPDVELELDELGFV